MFNARDIQIALVGRKNRPRQNSNNEEYLLFLTKNTGKKW
jgi:hypothetical protein